MLLGTLGTSLLINMLTGKILRAGHRNKERKGILKAGYGSKMDFYFQPNFQETLKYRSFITMNQDLKELILEIKCLET